MLPRSSRLTDGPTFRAATRQGRRAGSSTLVLHRWAPADADDSSPARIGFVVSRSVGGSVVRNRVKRRLRHLASELLVDCGPVVLVVRATPAAATASYAELRGDLQRCVRRVSEKRRSMETR